MLNKLLSRPSSLSLVLVQLSLFSLTVLFFASIPPTAAAQSPTPTSSRPTTRPSASDWDNTTLDQIKFSPPHPVLTHEGWMKIWQWLPDNRRLLVELQYPDAKDAESEYQIATLDVETGQLVEYGHRSDIPYPPFWIEQTQSVIYYYLNTKGGYRSEIDVQDALGHKIKIAENIVDYGVNPKTGDIYYCTLTEPKTWQRLNPIDLQNPQSAFNRLAIPSGKPLIDSQGLAVALVGLDDLPIVSLADNTVNTFHIPDDAGERDGSPLVTSAAWSSHATQLGAIVLRGFLGSVRTAYSELRLFNPASQVQLKIELPTRFVNEIDWSPSDLFLLARGTGPGEHLNAAEIFWLIDTVTGKSRVIPELFTSFTPEPTFMAWSPQGRLAFVDGHNISITEVTPTTPTTTPTLTPTPQSSTDWQHATLDQVHFSDPKIILSQNAAIKIRSWLPDNRRLLVELEDPASKEVETHYRIVTLDIVSGEIVEYGRRRGINGVPLWIAQTQDIVFYWEKLLGLSPEIRLGDKGGKTRTVIQGLASYAVRPDTGQVYYRLPYTPDQLLGVFDPTQIAPAASFPYPGLAFPPGSPLIAPNGQRMGIVGSPTWGILDFATGQLHIFPSLVPATPNSELGPFEQGTGNEQWSPNGKQIAFLQTIQSTSIGGRGFYGHTLALLNAETTTFAIIKMPIHYFMELDWSPASRFILVRGADPATQELYPNSYWLVDATTLESKMLDYFPRTADSTSTMLAWSADGKIAWVKNVPEGLGIAITQTSIQK